MKCYECKYNRNGVCNEGPYNECKKFGFAYYFEWDEEDCPYIDDDYNLTKEGEELGEIL